MSQIISLDSHERHSLAGVETGVGKRLAEERIEHRRGTARAFLLRFEPGSPVADETSGDRRAGAAPGGVDVLGIKEARAVPRAGAPALPFRRSAAPPAHGNVS